MRRRTLPGFRAGAARQRGAMLVIAAVVLSTILGFAALVAGRTSQAEARGAYHTNDALQALLSAETGVQRAAKRLSQGLSTCGAAGMTETITYPSGVSIAITSKTTDYDGATALASSKCRLEATATVTASDVIRKISVVVDRNIVDVDQENLDFNTGSVSEWAFSGTSDGAVYYRSAGGADGTNGICNNSAFVRKTSSSARYTVGVNDLYFNAYQAASTSFTFTFTRRYLIASGSNDNNSGNYARFYLRDSGGTTRSTAALNLGNGTTGQAIPTGNPPYATCAQNYSNQTTAGVSIPATAVNPIDQLQVRLQVRHVNLPGQDDKEAYLDNIVINPPNVPSGGTYMRILTWRECVPSPNNCV